MSHPIHHSPVFFANTLVPPGCWVVVLGDGEIDGVDLHALVNRCNWEYVLRTSKTATLRWEGGEELRFDDVVEHVKPGDLFVVPNASFTNVE